MEARKLQREIEHESLVQKEFNQELDYFIKKRTSEIKTKVEQHVNSKLNAYCIECTKQIERANKLTHQLEMASTTEIVTLTKREEALHKYSGKIEQVVTHKRKQIGLLSSNVEKDLINLLKEISTRAFDIKERIYEALEQNQTRQYALKEKLELLNESGLASKLTNKITKALQDKLSILTSGKWGSLLELRTESKDIAEISEEMKRSIEILEQKKQSQK